MTLLSLPAVNARCQCHKRENVLTYLGKERRPEWKRRLQSAWEQPSHELAKKALSALRAELKPINGSAAGSLDEGMDETLTLQKLGKCEKLRRSFKTTNCTENVNKSLELCTVRVSHWQIGRKNEISGYCRDRSKQIGNYNLYGKIKACTLNFLEARVTPLLLSGGTRRIPEVLHCDSNGSQVQGRMPLR
ncbi:MAG: transposase [Methylotenera sp.]|nr:transposase [Oligoflexia bacterium]